MHGSPSLKMGRHGNPLENPDMGIHGNITMIPMMSGQQGGPSPSANFLDRAMYGDRAMSQSPASGVIQTIVEQQVELQQMLMESQRSQSSCFVGKEAAGTRQATFSWNSREVQHSRLSQGESDDERTCNPFCKICEDDFLNDDKEIMNIWSKQEELLDWLPKWAQHRVVKHLVKKFAQKDKPEVPSLRIVAGAAIRNALFMTVARALFAVSFLALSLASVHCNSHGIAIFNWKIWCAWIPFQFLSLALELTAFQIVVMPKLLVLPRPAFLGVKLSFSVWLAVHILRSILGSIDLASDGAFLAKQWYLHRCERGMRFEEIWRQLWHTSLLGSIGADVLVPCYRVTCVAIWSLNLVPIAIALAQSLALPGSPGDYEIYHDADENDEWKVSYTTPWLGLKSYLTCDNDNAKQNHGAALMCLAEVNSWMCVVFDDYGYAATKAKDALYETPEVAAEHVYSQTQRQIQRALGGALTNGLQLLLQMTSVAMLKYDTPLALANLQPFFAITLSIIVLWGRIFTASSVLYRASRWEKRIKASIRAKEHPTKTFYYDDDVSISSWLESLPSPKSSIEMVNCRDEKMELGLEPAQLDYPVTVTVSVTFSRFPSVSSLTKSIYLLCIAVLICKACLGYGLAKFVMMSHCSYSLWNLTGCWVPPEKVKAHG